MTRKKRQPGPWERSHKTYAFRVSLEESKRIEELRKHQSIREAVMKSLGLAERDHKAHQLGMKAGQDEGYDGGFGEGYHRIESLCEVCGAVVQYDSRRPEVQAILDHAFAGTQIPHISQHVGPNAGPPRPLDKYDKGLATNFEEVLEKHPEYVDPDG